MCALIYISEDDLEQVEYLIDQSVQGHHVLFDPAIVREVMCTDGTISEEDAYEVEHHIENLITQSTLTLKRAYIEKLDSSTLNKVVRTYFNIIENNIYDNLEMKH